MELSKEEIKFQLNNIWRHVRKFFKKRPIIAFIAKAVGIGALAGALFWVILLIFGFRLSFINYGDGRSARFVGTVWMGEATYGKLIYNDGSSAQISGWGKRIENSDGTYYVGEVRDWRYNGKGYLSLGEGSYYSGEFKDGKMHGVGEYRDPDGGVYKGEFADGKPSGKGIYRYADGSAYNGDFFNGERHGYGVMSYPNGDVYMGDFLNGTREGHGKYIWQNQNGLFYEGAFENNVPSGEADAPVG